METKTSRPKPERVQPKFELGKLYGTPGAHEALSDAELFGLLRRHETGDWGDVGHEDWASNEDALRTGARLFSVYKMTDDCKVWVITEAEDDNGRRQATTVLLPDEY